MAASTSRETVSDFFGTFAGFEPCFRASEMSAFCLRKGSAFRAFFDYLGCELATAMSFKLELLVFILRVFPASAVCMLVREDFGLSPVAELGYLAPLEFEFDFI